MQGRDYKPALFSALAYAVCYSTKEVYMGDTKENFCTDCERDCSAPQCDHCVNGSAQLITSVNISFQPTFSASRIVVKGSEDEDYTNK